MLSGPLPPHTIIRLSVVVLGLATGVLPFLIGYLLAWWLVPEAIQEVPDQASLDDRLAEIEKRFIIDALTRADGVQVKAAQILGIKERSLWHRVKKYDIDVTTIRKST